MHMDSFLFDSMGTREDGEGIEHRMEEGRERKPL